MGWVPFGTRLNLETQKLVLNKLVCPWFSYHSRSYLKRCNLQRHAQLLGSASAAREAAPTPLCSWLFGSPFFMAIRGLDLYSAMACHGMPWQSWFIWVECNVTCADPSEPFIIPLLMV